LRDALELKTQEIGLLTQQSTASKNDSEQLLANLIEKTFKEPSPDKSTLAHLHQKLEQASQTEDSLRRQAANLQQERDALALQVG